MMKEKYDFSNSIKNQYQKENKRKVEEYYENTRKYYASYHNHKETSAWAGLILYVVFCGTITKVEAPIKNICLFNIFLSFLVIIVALLIFFM